MSSPVTNPASPEILSRIIQDRRTCKNFDDAELSKDSIENLLELAVFAPNHRLNEPWRFRVTSKLAILRWIKEFQAKANPEELTAFQKYFDKLPKLGALIFVSSLRDENPIIDLENYAAVCAAIQNILLGATAEELKTFWSTGKFFSHPLSFSFLNFPEKIERFVGAIWIGKGEQPTAKPRTPTKEKTIWID
jgi:nitroreductase